MYNAEQKQRFINQHTISESYKIKITETFNLFEKYEQKWGADLCTRTPEELAPILESLCSLRTRTINTRIVVLRDYVSWCKNNDIPNVKADFSNINPTGIQAMKNMSVSSPSHLQYYLNSVFEPEDKMTVANVYRCFFWLAFAGMSDEDIMKVKCSDVHIDKLEVIYNGMRIPLFRESFEAFKIAKETTHFIVYHQYREVRRERASGDLLVRGCSDATDLKSFRTKMSIKQKSAEKQNDKILKLNYSKVWLSGVYYRMFERERTMGEPPVFTNTAAKLCREDAGYRKRNITDVKRQLEEDYNRWKLAHFH